VNHRQITVTANKPLEGEILTEQKETALIFAYVLAVPWVVIVVVWLIK